MRLLVFKRRVARRDHRAPGKEEFVRGVYGDALCRLRRDGLDGDDRAVRRSTHTERGTLYIAVSLARQPEDVHMLARREGHSVLRLEIPAVWRHHSLVRPEAEGMDQLKRIGC